MDTSILSEPILPWAIALAVGFPLLMVALGELSALGRRRGWPAAGVVSGVRVLVVPTLALILFLRYILGLPADNTVVQLVKTVLWIAVLYQGLSFVNHVLFGAAPEGSWQAQVPSLVRDLVRFAVVGIGAAFIYSEVWGKEIGTAWAALGLGSVVIGLALQEPLGNTVSGLILLAERPLAVGDWITVDGVTGRVVEINWRSVRLQTTSLELKIVPNSQLYKGSFSNLSRPTLERAGGVELSFAYEVPPNRVKAVMMEVLRSVPTILPSPGPSVAAVARTENAMLYLLEYNVARQEDLFRTKDMLLTRAWYAAQRNGLLIPGQSMCDGSDIGPLDAMRAHPLLQPSEALAERIAEHVTVLRYGAGETLVAEGGPLAGLYVVLDGLVSLSLHDRAGVAIEIARVAADDFFGESTLVAGQPSDVAAVALEDTQVLVIEPAALQLLLEASPRLVRAMGHVLESRRTLMQGLRRTPSLLALGRTA
jgi:small-conductance mechanosensitive channel